MKKLGLLVVLLGALSTSAFADQIVSNCTSPSTDVNPPGSGSLTSVCGPGFNTGIGVNTVATLPVGAGLNSIKLFSRYSISLQLGGNSGSAEFRHVTDIGIADFDNTGFDVVNSPLVDMQWGGGADVPASVFNCSGNQATCAAIVALLNSGAVTITADFQNIIGSPTGVSVDFAWVIDYDAFLVPEPASLLLLGIGVLVLDLGRRAARRS